MGFPAPAGLCADTAGDVWITNEGEHDVIEYAHGGTQPIQTLDDGSEQPSACSVDKTTGNLAVLNADDVAVYPDASGYNDKGNLFVDGQYDHKGTFAFGELPKVSSNFRSIKISQAPSSPLDLQWAGRYIALAESNTVIYHVTVKGSKGTVVGTTLLNGPFSDTEEQFWFQGGTIVQPYETSTGSEEVGFWKYPTGGLPRKSIDVSEDGELFGTVVSLAQQ